ncbi:hypothetical protein SEA_RENAUD18_36 [Mycobacterium phage Renaud18]|uniref:Uncharacterized protein n=1 Tax=Mycobacterium phage Renaud18 TaxID=2301701 RepID=A0A385E2Q4_9CAUD|nr:hypothetical protein HWB85_gp036 [Mycobacterium phage Renaud18]AXQ65019.1 hypothetical protein SEA_RENAUD18_36 [Mycobacterium phage Renaud18]
MNIRVCTFLDHGVTVGFLWDAVKAWVVRRDVR